MTRATMGIGTLLIVGLAFGAGMYANGRWGDAPHGPMQSTRTGQGVVRYTCPMHPFIVRDSYGVCPICGMELVRATGANSGGDPLRGIEHVALSPGQSVVANVATVVAKTGKLAGGLDVTGIVAYDQEREGKVSAWLPGRIEKLLVKRVGGEVVKGRPVAEISSPDLVYAEQEYLLAFRANRQFTNSPQVNFSQSSEALMFAARDRLRLLGFEEEQFRRLEREGKPTVGVPIRSPITGVVVEKLAVEGQRVEAGEPLFGVADLSAVWVELEVFEPDFPHVGKGARVEITSRSYPGSIFVGKVSYVYPFLDPKTRTVRVRAEVPNPGLMLKPAMFVRGAIELPAVTGIVVPAEAVIDAGTRQVVWVEVRKGVFTPRDVRVGARSGDWVRVVSGLSEGEKIAARGAYLIDSESQLRGKAGGYAGYSGAGVKGEEPKARRGPAEVR